MMQVQEQKRKSFWARDEGTTGMIVLAAGAIGLFFALPTLLAFTAGLITLLGQTITIVALCTVLAGFLFLATNIKVQTLVSYLFKSSMRWLTKWFVEIDPIGIMKSYVDDLKKKRESMMDSKDKLSGQIRVLEAQIAKNDKSYNNAMATAKVAQDKGLAAQVQVQARQAGRLQKLNEDSFKPLLSQMQVHMRALNKYYEVTGTVIEDIENEVTAKKMEREMILASYSAMSAAKKILMGGTDQKELFDQAMEFVVEDYSMKMGEIEGFMENSRGFVEGLDLQNGVYEEEALKKLQAWENKADSILLGTAGKQQLMENTTVHVGYNKPIDISSTVDWNNLLKNTDKVQVR